MRALRVSLRERIELIGNPTRRFALIIPNLTVWESLASLRDFAYRGLHRDFFRKRAEWFEAGSLTVVWWIAAGTIPTVDDALARLAFIERFGPSPYAFEMGPQCSQFVVVRRDRDPSRLLDGFEKAFETPPVTSA